VAMRINPIPQSFQHHRMNGHGSWAAQAIVPDSVGIGSDMCQQTSELTLKSPRRKSFRWARQHIHRTGRRLRVLQEPSHEAAVQRQYAVLVASSRIGPNLEFPRAGWTADREADRTIVKS
jgi:hypothetical protein